MKNKKVITCGIAILVIAILAFCFMKVNKAAKLYKDDIYMQKNVLPRTDSRGQDISTFDEDMWVLAHYKDASKSQGVFYTLKNNSTGELIVVDGGWIDNEDKVRYIIKKLGGHVNAWFITHYDNDHVDAFNAVYENKKGIKIDQVYVTPLDYDVYMDNLRSWDTPDSFTKFLEVTKNDTDKVATLCRGDKLDICGLKVEVFNAYDEVVVDNGMKDLPNTSSLVFKISGQKDSVLFCGDCHGKKMGKVLIKEWGDKLKAEYVQLGHHGNNSFKKAFYEQVSPKVALFDAPQWLMEDDRYTAKKLRAWFETEDVECFDFSTDTMQYFWFQ